MGKLRIRLQRPIPGVDHLSMIDPEEFASLHGRWDDIAEQLGVDLINDFYVYEGENGKGSTKWHSSRRGLKAVRTVLDYYRGGKGSLSESDRSLTISVFESVESVLDDADLREIKFCFVGDY